MFSWMMAKFYDRIMADAEDRCLRDWRAALLQDLSGKVLELGCGTGANLEFYPTTVKQLALAEPDRNMRQKLTKKLPQYQYLEAIVLDYSGEYIPIPDNSVDAVVCTLVLCTVKNPQQILSEIYRILKPRGRLVFIEHVAAVNNPKRLKWQTRIEPIWKIIGCGCHLTRPTEQNLIQAGFTIQNITNESMRGVPPIVRPSIRGTAIK
jgi:ubiquinone/menaquinone biosynthesis C-methylase UbiE